MKCYNGILSVRLWIFSIYKFTSVLNKYQQRISSIIARDDNLVKSDAKKCQQSYQRWLPFFTFSQKREFPICDEVEAHL